MFAGLRNSIAEGIREFLPEELHRVRFLTLLCLRCLIGGVGIYILNQFVSLGTSPLAISIGFSVGVLLSSLVALTSLSSRGFWGGLIGGAVTYFAVGWLCRSIPVSNSYVFEGARIGFHINLVLLGGVVGAITTWSFWRYASTVTIEALLLVALAVLLLSGHRDYHFELPQLVHDLAWRFKVEHLTMLVVLGVVAFVGLAIYLIAAAFPGRMLLVRDGESRGVYVGRPRIIDGLIFGGALIFIISIVAYEMYSYFEEVAATRTANGVGQEKQAGLSPLGFHSALGSTNQPAALVRLDSDYNSNPYSPMLYLREQALSSYNGHELVIAPAQFDRDVNGTPPDVTFQRGEDQRYSGREKLIQSVYLLAEHKLAFAVDYPVAIVPLKNPNPSRFKAAYRATSLVPTGVESDFAGMEVGDPNWGPDERAHYLEVNPDPRYSTLAQKITDGISSPVKQATAITDYLSRNAIYTLTPNHDEKPGEDPVAPFLFGDMRGYCVHFSHALVYLFRAMGIPARVGTGYLTDLSQAKDGHILLRMSDRHAWAEVYIRGKGWMPFDVKPDKVESHADSNVDMNLLDELMGLLGPDEEILPKDLAKDDPALEERTSAIKPWQVILAVLFLLSSGFFVKLYLRFGWLLPGGVQWRARRAYISIASALCDCGLPRMPGETRTEYRKRVLEVLGVDTLSTVELLNLVTYSDSKEITSENIKACARADRKLNLGLPLRVRIKSLLSSASIVEAFVGGRRW